MQDSAAAHPSNRGTAGKPDAMTPNPGEAGLRLKHERCLIGARGKFECERKVLSD